MLAHHSVERLGRTAPQKMHHNFPDSTGHFETLYPLGQMCSANKTGNWSCQQILERLVPAINEPKQ